MQRLVNSIVSSSCSLHLDLSPEHYWESSDEKYLYVALSYAINIVYLRLDYCHPVEGQFSRSSLIQASTNGKLISLTFYRLYEQHYTMKQ